VEEQLAPALVGEDPTYPERLWEKMYSGSRVASALREGHSQPIFGRRGETMAAISGVDIALWDILGKSVGQPIYKLLGACRDRVRGYASGGWAPAEKAGQEMEGYAARGFSAVKMRVSGREGFSVETCVKRVSAARQAIGPSVELMVDAHGCLNVTTATRLALALEEYDIAWFEEPVSPDNHPGMAEVRARTGIPIAAGENEITRYDVRDLITSGAADIIQPDVAQVGGITEFRRVAALASAFGLRCIPHVWTSGILFAASLHLAGSVPNCHIFEVSQAPLPFIYEAFKEPFVIKDGYVEVPQGPGLGVDLVDDWQERFAYIPGPEYAA
jgi:L-alanine-DL-glutamate epimerase-like enolase superfamily enzyme